MEKQELLNKLLNKELNELKKMCFKYKHDSPFLRKNVFIKSDDLSQQQASGLYRRINGKHKYEFSHEIIIDNRTIDNYLHYEKDFYDRFWKFGKKYYKKAISQVIRHELIHGFCEEYYQLWSDIEGCNYDGSPIFLAVLYFLGGVSNHNCAYAFRHSELYKQIKKFTTFDEFDKYIAKLISSYNKVARENKSVKVINNNIVMDQFMFNSYGAGLDKFSQIKQEIKLIKDIKSGKSVESNIFQIGCCITPDMINKLISKKRCSDFKNYQYSKVAVCQDKSTVKTMYQVGNIK